MKRSRSKAWWNAGVSTSREMRTQEPGSRSPHVRLLLGRGDSSDPSHWSLGRMIMDINPNSIPTAFDVKSGLKL